MTFGKIEDAIKQLQRGDFIIIVDDENRENEGDLILAAEKVTPSKINNMLKFEKYNQSLLHVINLFFLEKAWLDSCPVHSVLQFYYPILLRVN